jgi:hypothetical protein
MSSPRTLLTQLGLALEEIFLHNQHSIPFLFQKLNAKKEEWLK